jgi:hypothetical protein
VHANRSVRRAALERLEAFVGEWIEQVAIPDVPDGRMVFEWALDRQFLIQRSEIPHPDFPDSIAIIAVSQDEDAYTQHYFDSRGVVRVYSMSLRNGTWTVVRDAPDFTPLDFSQRFTGTFADGGRMIAGAWESSKDSVHWAHDFDVTYTRVT